MTSDTKIFRILWQKSTNNPSLLLPIKFYASTIKNKRITRGAKSAPPQVQRIFKSPGKIGLKQSLVWPRSQAYFREAVSNAKAESFCRKVISLKCILWKRWSFGVVQSECRKQFESGRGTPSMVLIIRIYLLTL